MNNGLNNYINKHIYNLRCCMPDVTWQVIADQVNEDCHTQLTDDAARNRYNRYVASSITVADVGNLTIETDCVSEVDDELLTLRKEKMKLSDERTQLNALIRRMSREDTIKEIAEIVANSFNKHYNFSTENVKEIEHNIEKEAILQISDWHYGIDIDSPYNKYDTDICFKRVNNLFCEVINRCVKEGITRLHIVNLGDLIAGRIHLTLRLQSRIDAITQIIEVSEMLANFLDGLAKSGIEVQYYDTLDNHSRLEPKLNDSLDLESLTRITTWFLKERLRYVENIYFNDNTFGDDIVTFNVLGNKIIAVHGDKDKPENVVSNLSLMTQTYYDLALMAHRHHFYADEKNRTITLSNGSLMGTDDFAQKLRLNSMASQNLIIVTRQNVIDTVYRINVE